MAWFWKKKTVETKENIQKDVLQDNIISPSQDIPQIPEQIKNNQRQDNNDDAAIVIEAPSIEDIKNISKDDFELIFSFNRSVDSLKDQNEPKKLGFLDRLKAKLSSSKERINDNLAVFTKKKLDEDMLDLFEETLIRADLGVKTAMRLRSSLEKERFNKDTDQNDIKEFLSREIETYLKKVEEPLLLDNEKKPQVILFTGVNGSGKTTTIGKLSAQMQAQGLKTMMVAGDTFRAAAVEQLKIWGERTNTPVISKDIGADAAGLVYDAYQEAINQDIDVLLIDTAGRLQNKKGLMDELHKISKVLKKYDTNLPHHSILILDATTGQNAFQQVESFRYNAGITGIIVTKLDGSAKGGVLIGIAAEFILPVHGIGIGEKLSDLQRFRATDFTKAILE